MNTERNVTIPVSEYIRLKERDYEYQLHEEAGVDNWQGRDEVNFSALEEFMDELKKELNYE